MSTAMSTEGPKRRFLFFLCLTYLTLSRASTVTASREREDLESDSDDNSTSALQKGRQLTEVEKHFWMKRTFAQGQPELQQAMDNMLLHEEMIKRNLRFPPAYLQGYPALLTRKTGYLLSEAEHMLNRVKNLKERRWVENFVHRLKILASTLEGIAVGPYFENRGLNITRRGNIQSLGRALAPENHLPFIPSSMSTTVAPDHSEEQSTAKTPATSSKLSRVILPSQADGQVVAKPGLIQQLRNKKLDEDDELVRELENLHNVAAAENQPQSATPPAVTTSFSDPATPKPSAKRVIPMDENDPEIENEKQKIKEALIREVAALQRLGESPEDILNTLRFEAEPFTVSKNLQFPSLNYMQVRIQTLVLRQLLAFLLTLLKEGFKDPESIFNQNPNTKKEVHSFETEKNTLGDLNTEVKDVHSEESMISKVNRHVWRPSTLVHPASHPSKDMYMNKSFQGMHVNLSPMNEQILSRQLQNGLPKNLPHAALHLPHHNGIKNTIQKLQGQDYQFNNHIVHDQQTFQNDQHGIPAPVRTKQNNFLQHGGKNNFNPSLGLYRSGPGNGHGYNPYPYFPSINHKNSTIYGTQIFPSHNIDNNFSDEMKRQLRDGKVILLSDSVVRSNFEQTSEKDKDENGKTEGPDIKSEGKNETQAQN